MAARTLGARSTRKEELPSKPESLTFHGRVIFRCKFSSGKFQVKVRFNLLNGGQKGQFIFTKLFFDDVIDLVLSDEITIAFEFEAKSFARQNTS